MTKSEYEHIISLLIAEIDEWRRSRSDETKGTQADVDAWFGKEETVNTTADTDPNASANFWFNEGSKIAEDYDNLLNYHEAFEEETFRIFQEDAREIRELNDELNYFVDGYYNMVDYINDLERKYKYYRSIANVHYGKFGNL
jgi:hypothetical protein